MNRTVRTRFAPSPTGALHVGNLRVAIFNHVFARRHGGRFIVRVEDTDQDRNVEGAVEGILEDLRWAGLEWDEGPDREGPNEPYFQSRRTEGHRKRALELAERGLAYRCFCPETLLETAREASRTTPGCPGGCRGLDDAEVRRRLAEGEAAALRFAVPDGEIRIEDAVRGEVSFQGRDVGDFIILRSDGRPTYNFAVVVDDVDMEITHVIRGAGHLSNTPKQALLFDALEVPRPVFAHLPTVLGPDGRKLSKRTGAPGVGELRVEGFHPDGVVNYLSLLGWSPGDDREVFTRAELVAEMSLERVGASDTVFDPEKLRWMSARHIQEMGVDALSAAVASVLDRSRFDLSPEALGRAVEVIRTRLHTFSEANDHLPLLFPEEEALDGAREELRSEEGAGRLLVAVRDRLAGLGEDWTPESTAGAVREVGKELGVKGPRLYHPVRLAIAAARSGPDLGGVLWACGRERVLDRLERAAEYLV